MDEHAAAIQELARRIVAACAPRDLDVFDDAADDLFAGLPELKAGGPRRDKPTEFGGAVLYSLSQLAMLLADHLLAVLPGVATEVVLAKGLDKALERRRERRARRAKPAPPAKELLTVQVIRTDGEDAATEVRVVIGAGFYPAAAQTAVALLGYVAGLGETGVAGNGGETTEAGSATAS